jgi:hypothetical protein
MTDLERRIGNGELLYEIKELQRVGAENRTAIAEVKVEVLRIGADLRIHLAEATFLAERNAPLIVKINDLWDFRNRMLGGLALGVIFIPIISVIADRLIPR